MECLISRPKKSFLKWTKNWVLIVNWGLVNWLKNMKRIQKILTDQHKKQKMSNEREFLDRYPQDGNDLCLTFVTQCQTSPKDYCRVPQKWIGSQMMYHSLRLVPKEHSRPLQNRQQTPLLSRNTMSPRNDCQRTEQLSTHSTVVTDGLLCSDWPIQISRQKSAIPRYSVMTLNFSGYRFLEFGGFHVTWDNNYSGRVWNPKQAS